MSQYRTTVAKQLASSIQARLNCLNANPQNVEWLGKHTERIQQLTKDFLPSGAGFDNGTKTDVSLSHADKLVFHTSYHHMNEVGYYDGWTEHTVTVTPSFLGFNIRVTGRNRNEIKDHMHETFRMSLAQAIDWDEENQRFVSVKDSL